MNACDEIPENMDNKVIDPDFFSSFNLLIIKILDLYLNIKKILYGSLIRIIIQASEEKIYCCNFRQRGFGFSRWIYGT